MNVSLQGSAREMGVSFTQEGSVGLIQGLWVLLTCSESPGAGVDVVKRMEFPF